MIKLPVDEKRSVLTSYKIAKNNGLLIRGAHQIVVHRGFLRSLGLEFKEKAVIKLYSVDFLPFEVLEDAEISITSSSSVSFEIHPTSLTPPDWEREIKHLLEFAEKQTLRLLTIGPVASGKSTFLYTLANALKRKNPSASIVLLDLDVGQNKLVAPGVLSAAEIVEIGLPPSVKRIWNYFIGTKSPRGRVFDILTGLQNFLTFLQQNPRYGNVHLLIDTSGYVTGHEALFLKNMIIAVLQPNIIELFVRTNGHVPVPDADELYNIVSALNSANQLVIPPHIKQTSANVRYEMRTSRFRALREQSQLLTLDLDQIHMRSLFGQIQNLEQLKNRYVGLLDASFSCIGVGFIEDIDFFNKTITLWAVPIVDTPTVQQNLRSLIKEIVIGFLQIAVDGTEIYQNVN